MRIGVDIGGMSIKAGLVSDDYEIMAREVIPTESDHLSPEEVIDRISEMLIGLLGKNGYRPEDCVSIGIACPGTVDPNAGSVIYANNLEWTDVPFIPRMREKLHIPMAIANDADAAALAEVLCGAAAGKKDALLLTLGTGVGGGVIINRKIFCGPLRGGCEPGHMSVELNGRMCTCGRKGCLEMYASAAALMQDARRAAAENQDSLMNELSGGKTEEITGKVIFDAEKRGDPAAKKVVALYEDYLAMGIANMINIFRPEVVIIGGGVSAQGEYLTNALQERVDGICYGGAKLCEIPQIVTSAIGNDAGIIGAAFL